MMQLTDEQAAFINACRDTNDSLIVNAVAGSGKTTSSVDGINAIVEAQPMVSVLAVAFNKSIADELAVRMDPMVTCKTMNALGHRAWMRKINCKPNVNSRKNVAGFKLIFGDDFYPREELEDIYKLCSLAKVHSIVPNSPNDDYQIWENMIDHFDLSIDFEFINRAVDMCRQVLSWGVEEAMSGHIDFDDQLYMPINFGGSWQKFDVVLIDEAQDISGIQRDILRAVLKPGGRLIAVGDPHQAIYGFRGAAHDSMELIAEEFSCKPMGLTYSFRCPKAVVNEVKRYVPEIKPAPGAPDGMVVSLPEWDAKNLTKNDVIICRNTKPLVDIAFRLIKRGVSCYVLGRDIGYGLIALIKRMKAGSSLERLEINLEKFRDAQIAKYNRMGRPERAEAVSDRVDTMLVLIENLEPGALIKDLEKLINDMFSGMKSGLCLCTGHKAKGLEWNTVYFLDRDLLPSRYAVQPWQIQQEENLIYVICTRARQTLIYIESKELK